MPRFHSRLLIALLLLFSFSSGASLVLPDDDAYFRRRGDRILYVYDATARGVMPQIKAYMEAVRANYDLSFGWQLDEEEALLLTSPKQQIGNAFAMVTPNIESFWFGAGPNGLFPSAGSSWFLLLATHETSHLYQLNSKGRLNAGLKRFFGNVTLILPFIPIYLVPNQFTPTFLVEGNAVLNESRANLGGRLHSGEVRAMVLAQIKAGQIQPTRLINDEFRFPYGELPYYQGGYFQAHLAAKYGVDKTNQFFLAQGDHYLWPLILNKTFRDHFGASYPQEMREYVHELTPLAAKQEVSAGRTLVDTAYIGPLNHDGKRIFYLSSDGLKRRVLHIYDKATNQESTESLDLPLGKVFWDGPTAQSAASRKHDLHHIEYSLYGEGSAFDPRYRGQIVSDQRGQKTAALDAANSWLENRVLINGEFYDVGHSLPILDEEGNVYYFRQNGAERIAYKNRRPLFKFEGFYGKLVEVGRDGTIYFIANTNFGSSLYQFQTGEISRVLVSDRVIDARQISEGEFLAVEVGADGHRAVVTEAHRQPAVPANYAYGFPSYNLKPAPLTGTSEFEKEEHPYNSLSQLRYSGLNFIAQYDREGGGGGYMNAQFTDPIQYQQLDLVVSGSQFRDQNFLGQYTFSKYLPSLWLRYLYQKEFWHQDDGRERLAFNQNSALGMTLPLLRWRDWGASWDFAAIYGRNDKHADPSAPPAAGVPPLQTAVEETYGSWNSLSLTYAEYPDPPIAFFPWRSFRLVYQNKLESLPEQWRKKYNTSMVQTSFQRGFPMQFYATASANVAWAENHDVLVDYNPYPLSLDIRIPRLTSFESITAQTAGSARVEFTKVFNTPVYSPRIPIGLERVAPFLVGQEIVLDNKGVGYGDYAPNIFEWGFGADIQVLLLHMTHAKLRLLEGFDTRHPYKTDTQANLAVKYNF